MYIYVQIYRNCIKLEQMKFTSKKNILLSAIYCFYYITKNLSKMVYFKTLDKKLFFQYFIFQLSI